jgi:hypothetical protein
MSKNIPTAKQYLLDKGFKGHAEHSAAKQWMIEFAKLHVTAALKAASEKANIIQHNYFNTPCEIDEDSILNTYPLENIK